ncbi:uncharacterized protein LOC126771208 [Nymphalis io]|uniref:uncharacterized protein LOC126771208 n=1 Tax=Inachis io TaxID=171585 RepID=UPI00216A834B|nr:uncharacterized protein LOC126771208 [Nymphalis io]
MGDDYYLTPPSNQLFYRFMANMMSYFSVGKRTAWGYEKNTKMQVINSRVMTTFAPLCAISQIVYLYLNYTDLTFDILGIIFSVLPATFLANVDIYSAKMKSYKRISENFLQKIHLYNIYNWLIIHLINCYTVLNGVSSMMIFQCINYMFVYNIIGHIHILKHAIEMISDDLSDEEVHTKLGKIVDYTNFIIGIFKDVRHAFGYNVATNYLQNLFGNSIVMYQIMYGDKESMMLYVGMIMAYTGAPIILSFVLEDIKRQTDNLPDLVYSMPWEKMSTSNQKIVILILQRTQILMEFKALGCMKAGVGPMMSILKTTFSYYLMLESSIAKKI